MRGRDSIESGHNPLARRFQPDDEPDTIDLQQPAGFTGEPGTRDLNAKKAGADGAAIISLDPETGKFYAQPGGQERPVLLDGEAVLAPTELRGGDCVRIGDYEIRLLRVARED